MYIIVVFYQELALTMADTAQVHETRVHTDQIRLQDPVFMSCIRLMPVPCMGTLIAEDLFH